MGVTGEVTGRSLAVTGQAHDCSHYGSYAVSGSHWGNHCTATSSHWAGACLVPHTITCRLGSLGSVLVPLCVAQPPARAMPEVQPLRHLRGTQPQGINALRQMLHRRRVQSWTLVIRVHPLRQKLGPGSAKKTSLRKWAWPREPVGLAPPIPHAMQSWGMRQSRLLFTALSGDMESSPALGNIAFVGDGGRGLYHQHPEGR